VPVAPPPERDLLPGSLLPIRTVSTLTGVNPVTLRAWERRYQLITPQRTPKGHRLYSEADVEYIKRILDLLDQGISISQVKPLLEQIPEQSPDTPISGSGDVWKSYQQKALAAIENFDEHQLDEIYNEALSLYPVDIATQRLITPLLRLLGEHWQESDTGIAEEHFFSVYLRNKLGTRIHHLNQASNSPLLLLACLPGELHEIGLLFFALAAIDYGYGVLVLGANTPLEQLPGVLARRPCAGIVLSCSYRLSRGVLDDDLPKLVEKVTVPVLVGGKTSISQQKRIEEVGAVYLGKTFAGSLKRLSQTLDSARHR
jgi:MerR family transcriptional regulator, light-induced transcriptional regulator